MRITNALGCAALVAAALGTTGCATTTVEPGHRGLYFAPNDGGLRREALMPGKYKLGWCFLYCTPNRVDDFDVTYSTRSENIDTKDSDGLVMHLRLSVRYKPIESEIYQLDTEIGPNYYDEVIAPEFRSACRGVFARHSYMELQKKNEALENEVESELRRRTAGQHIDIASVTLEGVDYTPEINEKNQQRIAAEQEKQRQLAAIKAEQEKNSAESEKRLSAMKEAAEQKKVQTEAEAEQKNLEIMKQSESEKLELQKAAETQKMQLANEAANAKFKAEQALQALDQRRKAARAELEINKLQATADATTKVITAKADAEAARAMASAHAEEKRAETAGITQAEVMEHAYDALGKLGGTGTTIVLGDWAHVPSFLFPKTPTMGGFAMPWQPFNGPRPAGESTVLSDTK
jgi:regulator of protease activity HflC (stomatin/prohibitin superfamily)